MELSKGNDVFQFIIPLNCVAGILTTYKHLIEIAMKRGNRVTCGGSCFVNKECRCLMGENLITSGLSQFFMLLLDMLLVSTSEVQLLKTEHPGTTQEEARNRGNNPRTT